MSGRKSSKEIDDIAAQWAALVDSTVLDPLRQCELEDWLKADSRHLGAYAKASAILARLDRAEILGTDFNLDQNSTPRVMRRRAMIFGGVAVACTMAGLAATRHRASVTYVTARGEIRLIPLADGSVVTLNTASRMKVSFTTTERRIMLIEGEALFEVAKDPLRPFVVAAGISVVRAVGTTFTVRHLDDSRVRVLVQEGVVEVTPAATGLAKPVRTPANTEVIDKRGESSAVPKTAAPEDVTRDLAWREGKIAFNGVTLQQAVLEFARYNGTKINLEGENVRRLKVTGLFSAANPEGFARSVATVLGLNVEINDAGVILSQRPNS